MEISRNVLEMCAAVLKQLRQQQATHDREARVSGAVEIGNPRRDFPAGKELRIDAVQAHRPGHTVDVGTAGHLDEVIGLPAEAFAKGLPVQQCMEVTGENQRVVHVPEDEASLGGFHLSCSCARSLKARASGRAL